MRGRAHAHAYALALKKLTGVAIEQMLPTPNFTLDKNSRNARKYLARRYTSSRSIASRPNDYQEMAGIWSKDEMALPGDPPGKLEVVEGAPEGVQDPRTRRVIPAAITQDYAPEEMFEIASKLYKKSR